MVSIKKGKRLGFSPFYFDFFWGCPGCRRALSIAGVIERHCEACEEHVEPVEMSDRSLPGCQQGAETIA
ncbi:hypothetical protein G6L46_11890 [Agrobacterium rhizogenes]|uniref:hypothetical protein n=1 Tax=Rhizobium TaxID=379 RepID=UPI00026ED2BE|nr:MULTISPECIES: hypothetical protein [Rhizobium]EJK79459.1 hypothetical protein PMI03_05558 [Rhizobium sp. AP16]NTF87826.1 hypothetical protein [Rhizobium rhizogenes]